MKYRPGLHKLAGRLLQATGSGVSANILALEQEAKGLLSEIVATWRD